MRCGVTRVAVFVDYQNTYHGARKAFGDPHSPSPPVSTIRSRSRRCDPVLRRPVGTLV